MPEPYGEPLRLLVDRTSLELFVPPGRVSAGFCFLPEARDALLGFSIDGGSAVVTSLAIHELVSAWR